MDDLEDPMVSAETFIGSEKRRLARILEKGARYEKVADFGLCFLIDGLFERGL
jgi:hypothetical protein